MEESRMPESQGRSIELSGVEESRSQSAIPTGEESPTAARRDDEATQQPSTNISRATEGHLFLSHFLSTWNSRLFEAGVVYFLAAIFKESLQPISIYALVRNAVAIVLSVPLGTWIDHSDRLLVVRLSILSQRISVAASCAIFLVMLQNTSLQTPGIMGLFAITVALACVEKLSASVNLISVERDWLVVMTEGNEISRRKLNARMRRIDLFCKLLGPLVIALIAAASISVAIYVTLGLNLVSVAVEYLCIEKVCRTWTLPHGYDIC
jgi:iron-regulated transporter 1